MFCYDPADEIIVRHYVAKLKEDSSSTFHIVECDLYEIFLKLLEDKRVLSSVEGLEERRGKDYLLKQLQKIATPEALLEYMANIKDIANKCGLSISTVSKALNSYSDISSATRQRVLETAQEFGYFPSSIARALKTNRTHNIGVLFVDDAQSGLKHAGHHRNRPCYYRLSIPFEIHSTRRSTGRRKGIILYRRIRLI